jgi:division protein CdvB (Snf7/Vps24/ESCRT-III family)
MEYPKEITKQVISFYKTTFENSYSTMVMLQEQAEKLMKTILDQAPWMTDDGRKALDQWVGAYRKGREEFKKSVDDGYKKVEEFFSKLG